MRNLKRALSLALASVMLLGMMVIGTSAASNFTDADKIVNTEAAAITGGLGIFAGANGEFMPEKAVTRAEMATIIVKMLYGNDYNANPFKGIEKYSDVADYQGGWAEGYINLCTSLKIFGGYGDGTFKPGKTVTTAEAASMILSALGLNKNLGEWPLGVMTKATEIGLFGDLKLTADTALTRDNLSVLVLNGLEYTPNGGTVYMVGAIEFDNMKDAAMYAAIVSGTVVPTKTLEGSLASTVYGMKTLTGIVQDNGATVAGQKYTTVAGTKFATATDLDLIGRNVTVYYKDAKTEPTTGYTTYTVLNNTTEVEITSSMDAAKVKSTLAAAGITTNLTASTVNKIANGVITANGNVAITLGTTKGSDANVAGTYLVADKAIIGVVAATTYTADKISDIVTTSGSEAIKLKSGATLNNNATSDVVNEYEGIAKGDYVLVTKCDEVYNLAKVQTVEGAITKIASDKVTVNGTTYDKSGITNSTGLTIADKDFKNTFKLYLDATGKKYFAIEKVTSTAVASDIVYVVGGYDIATVDDYGVATVNTYAQVIDLDGVESRVLVGVKKGSGSQQGVDKASVTAGFVTFAASSTPADAKLGIQTASAAPTTYNATTAPVIADTLKDETSVTVKTASLVGDNAGKAYVNSATKYIFLKGENASLKTNVVVGGINSTIADEAKMLLTKDADGNYIVKAIIAGNTYTNAGVTAADYLYIKKQTTPAQTAKGYEFTVYSAETGAKSTIIATNSKVNNDGFYKYSVVDGVYTIGDKVDAVTSGNGVYESQVYAGKFGTKISSTNLTDVEAGSAVVVDLRDAKTIKTDGVAAITSIEAMHAAKTAATPKLANFTCLVNSNGVVIIFITSLSIPG